MKLGAENRDWGGEEVELMRGRRVEGEKEEGMGNESRGEKVLKE